MPRFVSVWLTVATGGVNKFHGYEFTKILVNDIPNDVFRVVGILYEAKFLARGKSRAI